MRVVLICSNPVLGRLVLPALRRMRARVSLICEPQAQHLRWSRGCARLLLVSEDFACEAGDRVVEAINRLVRKEGVDCVLASDTAGLVLLSGIAQRLECPTYPVASADVLLRLNDKWHFHRMCRDFGVQVPETQHYTSKAQLDPDRIGSSIGYPVIVKPVGQWSSAGVAIIDSPRKLQSAIVENPDYRFQDVVVQQYIEGEDGGFGGLAIDGDIKCWTTFLLPAGGAVEFTPLPQLFLAAEKIVKGLRFSGVINLDARVDVGTGAVRLIECNPRFFVRVRAARLCGLDFVRAGVMSARATGSVTQSLTRGRFFPLGRLMSWDGIRQLATGGWSIAPMLRSLTETLSDPLPLVAEALRPVSRIRGADTITSRPVETRVYGQMSVGG